MAAAHDDDPAGARPAAGRATWIQGLLWDVGLPVAGYYGLRLAGASAWVALLGATLAAGGRIVWVAVRDRKLNPFATVLLIVFGLGLALVFVSGDPRFLLFKQSITSGAIGIAFLVSVVAGRPLTLAVAQSWQPGEAQELETLYRTDPDVRHGFRVSSWGRCAGPPWRRENGVAPVRDADVSVMPPELVGQYGAGATDRNCRLLP